MKSTVKFRGAAAIAVGLGLIGAAGCAGLQQKSAALRGQDDRHLAAAAGVHPPTDAAGRLVPEPLPPVSPVIPEASVTLTSETRAHVALAVGQMLEEAGKLGDAQAYYEQTLKLDPKSVEAQLALARVYTRRGRPDAALKLYERAEKLHRKNAAVYNDKGLHLAEQKNWPAAIETLKKAVKLEPASSKYHNNLGLVLASSGDYDAAWKEFREAVGAGPAHHNVALMLLRAGRTAEARVHLQQALAAMPGLKDAESLLAELNSRPENHAPPKVTITRVASSAGDIQTVSHEVPADQPTSVTLPEHADLPVNESALPDATPDDSTPDGDNF